MTIFSSNFFSFSHDSCAFPPLSCGCCYIRTKAQNSIDTLTGNIWLYALAYIHFPLCRSLSIFITIRSCVSLDWPDNSRADLRLMLHTHCFNSIPALDFRRHIPYELRSVISYGPIQFHSSFPPFLVFFLLLYLHTQSPNSKMGGKCFFVRWYLVHKLVCRSKELIILFR